MQDKRTCGQWQYCSYVHKGRNDHFGGRDRDISWVLQFGLYVAYGGPSPHGS